DALFQFHHQPFNYYAAYAPGTAARAAHLQDEANFIGAARTGHLKPVSFVKPVGEENEHPGYASEHDGSDHLVDLIKAIQSGPQTLSMTALDEHLPQWHRRERHAVAHAGPPDRALAAFDALTWREVPLFRVLMGIRSLGTATGTGDRRVLTDFTGIGFTLTAQS